MTPGREFSLTIPDTDLTETMINFGGVKSIPQAKLYSILDKSLSRYTPKGAAVSMSPCLLANSFCVDFYELYKQHLDEGDELIQNVMKRQEEKDDKEEKRIEELKLKARKHIPATNRTKKYEDSDSKSKNLVTESKATKSIYEKVNRVANNMVSREKEKLDKEEETKERK